MPDRIEVGGLPDPQSTSENAFDARGELAWHFIRGEGLEIGALHWPLDVPPDARVKYVDRLTVEELRREYPERADAQLTPVDIVDDGERLARVPDGSQDFIIANHFLEHCEDPIGTIETHLRKLRPDGILFYAVPDKRYTFDFRRPVTTLEHLIADHEHGPERSRSAHYQEWARLVPDEPLPQPVAQAHAQDLESARFSIHMHVWTQAEFLELLLHCRQRFSDGFEIEAFRRRSLEVIAVLRKAGGGTKSDPAATNPPPDRNSGVRTVLSQPPVSQNSRSQVTHHQELNATRRALEEAEQRAAAAEYWLAELRRSVSWRITAPLRAFKKAALRLRK